LNRQKKSEANSALYRESKISEKKQPTITKSVLMKILQEESIISEKPEKDILIFQSEQSSIKKLNNAGY
jgi:hypothetical protein